MLRIDKTDDGRCTVLMLDGELSYDTSELLMRKVEEFKTGPDTHIVLDFGGVDFVDSSGASALLKIRNGAKSDLHIVLSSVPAGIQNTLQRLGVLDSYRVFRSSADAVLELR